MLERVLENDLTRHAGYEMHKKAILAKGSSNIGAFFASIVGRNEKIAVSENTLVYHTVEDGLSYNSTDCLVKLNGTVAKRMYLGGTKMEMTMNLFGT